MHKILQSLLLLVTVCIPMARAADPAPAGSPAMLFGDTSTLGRPYSKDPSVVRFQDKYLMYYSLPGREGGMNGWSIGIAQSDDLTHWTPVGNLLPAEEVDKKGLCAPGAVILEGIVHLFYQSYGNGPKDAICHAWSKDGVHFERDPANPIFRPTGKWSVGRAIDADAFPFNDKLYLYYATRDPGMKIQQVGVACADLKSGFGPAAWTDLCPDGPILKPELPWEKDCIEAPSVCRQGNTLFMFYAGAYNNAPQQIGVARSQDATHWTRLSEQPFLPVGAPGTWNSSESGHPGVFTDQDGQTYLFYQGNNDQGRTWLLSKVRIGWKDQTPVILAGGVSRAAEAGPRQAAEHAR